MVSQSVQGIRMKMQFRQHVLIAVLSVVQNLELFGQIISYLVFDYIFITAFSMQDFFNLKKYTICYIFNFIDDESTNEEQ